MANAIFLANSLQGAKDVDALSFDAIVDFKVTQPAKVTNNPTESGASITDHYHLEPKTVSFNGVVTPWNFTGQGSDLSPLQVIAEVDRTMKGKVPFDILLSEDLQAIRNCLITRFDYDRSASEGQSIKVSVVAQQILIVKKASESSLTEYALADAVAEQGQDGVNGGDGVTREDSALVDRFGLNNL